MKNKRIGAIAVLYEGKIISWKATIHLHEDSTLNKKYFAQFNPHDCAIKYKEFTGRFRWAECRKWFGTFEVHPQHLGEPAPRKARPCDYFYPIADSSLDE